MSIGFPRPILLANTDVDDAYTVLSIDFSKITGGVRPIFNGAILRWNQDSRFNLGIGDFTIDFWLYPLDLAGYRCWLQLGESVPFIFLTTEKGFTGELVWWNEGNAIKSSIPMKANHWNHIALVRYSGLVTMYFDGVKVGQTNNSSSITYSKLSIGANTGGGQPGNGYMDKIRISKGIARWIDEFIPPPL